MCGLTVYKYVYMAAASSTFGLRIQQASETGEGGIFSGFFKCYWNAVPLPEKGFSHTLSSFQLTFSLSDSPLWGKTHLTYF